MAFDSGSRAAVSGSGAPGAPRKRAEPEDARCAEV